MKVMKIWELRLYTNYTINPALSEIFVTMELYKERIMNQNHLFKYVNNPLPDEIKEAKDHGYFDKCQILIDKYLETNIDEDLRNTLILQKEIIKRLPDEYTYTLNEVLDIIREYVPDFKDEEFNDYDIDYIYINDVKYYFNRFLEVMVNSFPEFTKRLKKSHPLAIHNMEENSLLKDTMRIIKDKGSISKRITIRNTIKIKDEYFKEGDILVHIPIPKSSDYISDITINKIYPEICYLDDDNASQKTVCFKEHIKENHEFMVEYSFTNTSRYVDFDEMMNNPVHLQYLQPHFNTDEEIPHLIFTDKLKELSDKLTKGINDPLLKVKAFYDYITLNIRYSFMPSYFVLDNIIDYAINKSKGDCGVKSLLFIALCRLNGIPAIWQSGYTSEYSFCGGHDWAAFYLEPYGYIYTDVSYGVDAVRYNDEERRIFYMTNLDPYRMLANDRFYADFSIAKENFRSDPYDNQLGEIEYSDHGLDFMEYDRHKEVIKIEDI